MLRFALLLASFLFACGVLPKDSPLNAANAPDNIEVYYVDRIHINVYYDEWMNVVFCQTLFEDWNKQRKCFVVQAWRGNKFVLDTSDEDHKAKWIEETSEYFSKIRKPYTKEILEFSYNGKVNPSMMEWPIKDGGEYKYIFFYGNRMIKVNSKYFIMTHSQVDPERLNRKIWPEENRRKLWMGEYKTEAYYHNLHDSFRLLLGGEK